jgi:uncharacterized protein YciW
VSAPRIAGAETADAVLALRPELLRCHRERRAVVMAEGLVDRRVKELCARYLADDDEVVVHADDASRFDERERAALAWVHAALWSPESADDALWERLHANFTEPELVELFYFVQWIIGERSWLRTLGIESGLLPQ